MGSNQIYPTIDYELVRLQAQAADLGMIRLATWGTKETLQKVLVVSREEASRMTYKCVHITEVPAKLIEVRDNWRYFWSWIPILGWVYRRYYVKLWDKWTEENNIGMIDHHR